MSDNSFTAAERAQRAAGVSRNIEPGGPSGCFVCQGKLFIQFFFDGLGRSREDEPKGLLSNIAKLYHSACQDEKRGIYARYIEGPGTELKGRRPLSAPSLDVMGARASEEAKLMPSNVPGEVMSHAFEHGLEYGSLRGAVSIKGVRTGLYGLLIEGAAGWAADAVPYVRDTKLAAQLMQAGYADRLLQAHADLQAIVDSQTLKITEIHIAVYGADRGATLARAFVNQLIERSPEQGRPSMRIASSSNSFNMQVPLVEPDPPPPRTPFRDSHRPPSERQGPQPVSRPPKFRTVNGIVPIYFRFMGLFDAQSSLGKWTFFGVPAARNDAGDLYDLAVPDAVEVCVHLAAAHEMVYANPVHTIGRLDSNSLDWMEAQARRLEKKAEAARAAVAAEATQVKNDEAMSKQVGVNLHTPRIAENIHIGEADDDQAAVALDLRMRALALRRSGATRIERLFVGSSADVVGGGFTEGQGGKSNELSRLPLREMQRQAYVHGCPMRSIAQLKHVDPQLANSFALTTLYKKDGKDFTVEDLHKEYMRNITDTLRIESLSDHAERYMHWLNKRVLELDAMSVEQRSNIHEYREGHAQNAIKALKERGVYADMSDGRIYLKSGEYMTLSERRLMRAFVDGGDVHPLVKVLFDYFVHTPGRTDIFRLRQLDVTEDKSAEGKEWQKQRADESELQMNARDDIEKRMEIKNRSTTPSRP